MDGKERRSLMCKLINMMREKGSWAGETHIQKTVMFLQELMRVPLCYRFVIYKHGPYSFDLHRELGEMVSRRQIDIELRYPGYGPSFRLGRWGEKNVGISTDDYDDAIFFVSERLSTKNARELESLSTAFFLKEENPDWGDARLAEQMLKIKPHITADQAYSAIKEEGKVREAASSVIINR